MQQNPFMLYAGQEFGERGMDEEGFSGRDGRTTIFDYWAVGTLRRGYFDRRKMTREEMSLEAVYSLVLNIACTEKAVSDGCFYDLMYVNGHIGGSVYALIRKCGSELLLVAANFSGDATDCDVVIPRHAFEYLQMGEGLREAKDLLSGDKCVMELKADGGLKMDVPAYGGRVWKMTV